MVSDDVVINHLKYLHPFQYKGRGETLYSQVYVINFYHYNIYLKLNTRDCKVVSFHYDEEPGIKPKLREEFFDKISDDKLMIIEDDSSGTKPVLKFAIGSTVIIDDTRVFMDVDGATYIQTGQLLNILNGYTERLANKLYKRLYDYDTKLTDVIDTWVKDYDFLTFVDEDKELQLISFCYDLWLKDKQQLWLKDMAIDLLMSFPEHLQQRFISQLYKEEYDYPTLPTKEFEVKVI